MNHEGAALESGTTTLRIWLVRAHAVLMVALSGRSSATLSLITTRKLPGCPLFAY